jgi:hypothetical protein
VLPFQNFRREVLEKKGKFFVFYLFMYSFSFSFVFDEYDTSTIIWKRGMVFVYSGKKIRKDP